MLQGRHLLLPIVLIAAAAGLAARAQLTPGEIPPPEQAPAVIEPGPPPADATVLFDGRDLSRWRRVRGGGDPGWRIEDGAMVVVRGTGDIETRDHFGDVQVHLEWATPREVKGEGQGRGNSGVFLQGRYEIQVLDSYQNETYYHGQAGAIYKQYAPLVNASRPPGEWQRYDIVFRAPRFDDGGKLVAPARMTAFHNGVLIQDNVEILGTTVHVGGPSYTAHGEGPLRLQDHGDPVRFRNIWVRRLEPRRDPPKAPTE